MLFKVINKFKRIYFDSLIKKSKNFYFGKNLILKGKPIIEACNGGEIFLGENVTLNSRNKGYHAGLFSPVKLFADRKGAKIEIGDNTRIHGSCIHAYSSIKIGKNCLIAANCQIFDGSGHDLCLEDPGNRINTLGESKPIVISDNVWLGINCIVLPGVSIGEGSVVAAGSTVVKNIPARSLAAGNPAKILKSQI